MSHLFSSQFWQKIIVDTERNALTDGWAVIQILIFYLVLRVIINRVLLRVIRRITEKGIASAEHRARVTTLEDIAWSTANVILVIVFGIMLLRALGVDITPLLTTAGIAGLAIGLGSQKLFQDTISGFLLISENQFVVGEYVTIGAVTGLVAEVGMRTTWIREDNGKLTIIANGSITQVTNHSRGPLVSWIDVGLAAGCDMAAAMETMAQCCKAIYEQHPDNFQEAPTVQGVISIDSSKIVIRVAVNAPLAALTTAQSLVRTEIYSTLQQKGFAIA
ncbi:MAG: mechanosensitive ion channel family protein [Armatimonadetes bacterium]|nr:mechanosensitive ion channel family protein [Armatimonadota bacterium]